MNKILLAIPHYGSTNRKYLLNCLREYNSFRDCQIVVHIYSTEEFNVSEFSNLTVYFSEFDSSIGQMLVHQHKPWFFELKDQFDYFIYCEDDVFITEWNFQTYIKEQKNLPTPFACGFLRYEHKPNKAYKFLFDQHPVHSIHRRGKEVIKNNYIINQNSYFEVYNIHQGCYILTKDLLDIAIKSGKYLDRQDYYAGHPLEGAASDVYYKCNITKVIPRLNISNLVVHHLPNKYVNMLPDIYTEETTPDDKKLEMMQIEKTPIYV